MPENMDSGTRIPKYRFRKHGFPNANSGTHGFWNTDSGTLPESTDSGPLILENSMDSRVPAAAAAAVEDTGPR